MISGRNMTIAALLAGAVGAAAAYWLRHGPAMLIDLSAGLSGFFCL